MSARAAWRDARTGAGRRPSSRRDPRETSSCPSSAWRAGRVEVLASAFEEQMGLPSQAPEQIEPANVFPAGLPAALVARALGLRGPAYTLDAACATSLYSIALAAGELRRARADAMLCGGVSRPDALYMQMGFSQLRALSARGRPCSVRPERRRSGRRRRGRACSCSSAWTMRSSRATGSTGWSPRPGYPTTAAAICSPPAARASSAPCGRPIKEPASEPLRRRPDRMPRHRRRRSAMPSKSKASKSLWASEGAGARVSARSAR